jgi:hypothetical protein
MHVLFSVYFVNLYMFRAYLAHHQEAQPCVYNNWYLLFFLDDCLLSCRTTDDGPTYARNMYGMTKYITNKLCIKLVLIYTIISILSYAAYKDLFNNALNILIEYTPVF